MARVQPNEVSKRRRAHVGVERMSLRIADADKIKTPASLAAASGPERHALLKQHIPGTGRIALLLFVLATVFQRQIVPGLTQGAVKG